MAENRLEKYKKMYKKFFEQIKSELKDGKKQTHWMWFAFPQLKGLGRSMISSYYGLEDLQHAIDFYNDDYLRNCINELFKLVLKLSNYDSLLDCFGEIDALKFHSCATMFYIATKKRIFWKALKKFFSGCLDAGTVILLDK